MEARYARRGHRYLSRATLNAIDSVFSRAGDGGVWKLRLALEDLAARQSNVESSAGDVMPIDLLLEDLHAGDEPVDKDGFTQFVAAKLQQYARTNRDTVANSVRYVSAWEYAKLCVRCKTGTADERGITRYWSGVSHFDPKISVVIIVGLTALVVCLLVIGILVGIRVPGTLDEAVRAGQSVLDVVATASDSLQSGETAAFRELRITTLATLSPALEAVTTQSHIASQGQATAIVSDYAFSALQDVHRYFQSIDDAIAVTLGTMADARRRFNVSASFANASAQQQSGAVGQLDAVTSASLVAATLLAWTAPRKPSEVPSRSAMWFDLRSATFTAGVQATPWSVRNSSGIASCGVIGSVCSLLSKTPSAVPSGQPSMTALLTVQDANSKRHRVGCVRFTGVTLVCLAAMEHVMDVVQFEDPLAKLVNKASFDCNAAITDNRGSTWMNNSGVSRDPTTGNNIRSSAVTDVVTRAATLTAANVDIDQLDAIPITTRTTDESASSRVVLPMPGSPIADNTHQLYVECRVNSAAVFTALSSKVGVALANTTIDFVFAPTSTVQFPTSAFAGNHDPVDAPYYVLSRSHDIDVDADVLLDDNGTPVLASWTRLGSVDLGLVQRSALPRNPALDDGGYVQTVRSRLDSVEGNQRRLLFLADSADGQLFFVGQPLLDAVTKDIALKAAQTAFFRRRARVVVETNANVAVAGWVPTINVVAVSVHDRSAVLSDVWVALGIACAVGFALCLCAIFFLMLVSSSVLGHAQTDSIEIRDQIDAEKTQFSALIRDAMPAIILTRFRAGETLIGDYYPQLTFFFSDVVSFTERTKFMSNPDLVRFLGYTFMVLDSVAEYYEIHKVKSIGDAFFAVSGLEDGPSTNSSGVVVSKTSNPNLHHHASNTPQQAGHHASGTGGIQDEHGGGGGAGGAGQQHHQTYRMISFAAVSQMLLTPLFHHVPERTQCFADAAGGIDQPLFKPAPCRIGIHVGPAYAGVFDAGRAPQFDCVGGTVGVCALLEAAAVPGTIRISEAAKRILSQVDTNRDFVCSAPQRTLAKNQGRIETYTVVATFLGVPQALLELLRIDRSVKRRTFGEGGFMLDEVDRTGKLTGIGDEAESHIISEGDETDDDA